MLDILFVKHRGSNHMLVCEENIQVNLIISKKKYDLRKEKSPLR